MIRAHLVSLITLLYPRKKLIFLFVYFYIIKWWLSDEKETTWNIITEATNLMNFHLEYWVKDHYHPQTLEYAVFNYMCVKKNLRKFCSIYHCKKITYYSITVQINQYMGNAAIHLLGIFSKISVLNPKEQHHNWFNGFRPRKILGWPIRSTTAS